MKIHGNTTRDGLGARTNHYMFDLNRDWTWQTQVETQQRVDSYSQFMPQVHADFHEMGPESTFFFAPAADPWNDVILHGNMNFINSWEMVMLLFSMKNSDFILQKKTSTFSIPAMEIHGHCLTVQWDLLMSRQEEVRRSCL